MDVNEYTCLVDATNALTKEGYTDDFKAEDGTIKALYSKKQYKPEDLLIVKDYRFDNDTNPDDEVEIFAIIASDGTRGTLVMSYSSEHSNDVELIRGIEEL